MFHFTGTAYLWGMYYSFKNLGKSFTKDTQKKNHAHLEGVTQKFWEDSVSKELEKMYVSTFPVQIGSMGPLSSLVESRG